MKLAIITLVKHSTVKGQLYGYGPYVREINLWSKYVDELLVVGVKNLDKFPSKIDSKYSQQRITFITVPDFNLLSIKEVLKTIVKVPLIFIMLCNVIRKADHIHLRCPANVSLIGCVAQIFFPRTPKSTKYAGNWDPNSQQPWSYRLQQAILRNRFLTRNMQVLVYGQWPGEPPHVKPFISATFYEADKVPFQERNYRDTIKLVFAASLVPGKRPLLTIQIVEALNQQGYPAILDMFGDGPLMEELKDYVVTKGLQQQIIFHGNQDIRLIMDYYKQAHFNILPSKSEGWPKAVAEGMFFGCVPIATAVSCVDWMLDFGKRGIIIDADLDSAVSTIIQHLQEHDLSTMAQAAQAWSQQYTFDRLEADIERVLKGEF